MAKKKPRVVVTRKLPDAIETRLMELFDVRLNVDDEAMSEAELTEAVKTADVLVPTITDTIDAKLIAAAGKKLKLIANYGAGVDIGQHQPVDVAELLGELAETGADLEDRAAAVRGDQVVLVAAVPRLVPSGRLELTARGRCERPPVLGHMTLPVNRACCRNCARGCARVLGSGSPAAKGMAVLRVLVLGGDGYLGWPTALHLSDRGHDVAVLDNFARRGYDDELGVCSLVPIEDLTTRVAAWEEHSGKRLATYVGDLLDAEFVYATLREFAPDAVVHFAEQRAAPYSMIDRAHAVYTQHNNVIGTLNLLYGIGELDRDIHLVKLGTMGEYGTPNVDIEEGWLELEHNGRRDRVLFPKRPGSFYHLSKVHDSHNMEFTCRAWGLRATDLNQGVVYGQTTPQTALDPRLATRFDYDSVFGTVLNRFVIQAVLGEPLTVYGTGNQIRGLIDIRDTVECIRLAVENPAERGEFRVFNQMTESKSVRQIADVVSAQFPGPVQIEHLTNPRIELQEHYYNVKHTGLVELGLDPHLLSDVLIESMFPIVEQNKHRVDTEKLYPTVQWTSSGNN